MAEILTAEAFAPHVGKCLHPQGQHRVLTLVSMNIDDRPDVEFAGRKPFTLRLRGAPGDVLPEGIYHAVIDDGPAFDLYIIPIHTMSREHQDYQVVVN
ncbi:MAG TPA: hypothetical protein VFE41_12700 [Acetobacteraceae bacterium]|jgi:hypothetical protein|nr:hypothetical protein [Acetobacteraceae bacterium]